MRMMLKQLSAVSLLTAIEVIRQPISLLVTTCCVMFIGLLPMLINHTLGESAKLVRDSGLALYFLAGLVLSAYAASSTVEKEIERGTVGSILSKPVSRGAFLFAKALGVCLVILLYSFILFLSIQLSLRSAAQAYNVDLYAALPLLAAAPVAFLIGGLVNFFARRPFSSNAFVLLLFSVTGAWIYTGFTSPEGQMQPFGVGYFWPLFPACLLLTLAILLLQVCALALATRLAAVPTLCVCMGLLMLGLMSDYVFGRSVDHSLMAQIAYSLIPNWQHFWMADALSIEGVIPWAYVREVFHYFTLYLSGLIVLAAAAFKTMDIK